MEAGRSEVKAAWATAIDLLFDIERIMGWQAATYLRIREPHRFQHLIALYYLTTQVKLKDAALVAAIKHRHLLDNYVGVIRKEVLREFGELYQPGSLAARAGEVRRQSYHGRRICCPLGEKALSQMRKVKGHRQMRACHALEAAYHCTS